ncbi:MAG: hypothetical protein KDI65_08720 [Alphaproteobacteria bacterium]|nr:hypothetical protein [Alphaproteobacteria bacterium]
MKYNATHYAVFSQSLYKQEGAVGHKVKDWWKYVTSDEKSNLPCKKLTRTQLKELCRNKSFSNKECLGAVMAWGGQNRKHGETVFSRFKEIKPIISDMRSGQIDHIQAYKNFYQIWKQDKQLGMGAAYFTKLIFFCQPSHQGFIMDQWTSKSTNLFCDEDVIHLIQGWVSKKNDHKTYEKFCSIVCDLAIKLSITPEDVEMAMFSKGGRKKEKWRQYVIEESTKRT